MTQQPNDTNLGDVTLEPYQVEAAHHLIDRLTGLLTGAGNNQERSKKARREFAVRIAESRRARASHLPNELFDEPAWDILLQLYCEFESGAPVALQALSQSVSAPQSTLGRWLDLLVQRDLVERVDDVAGNGRAARLSGNGFSRLDAYFGMLLRKHFSE
jgi:DNA-binding MarR family transcriptional regulator